MYPKLRAQEFDGSANVHACITHAVEIAGSVIPIRAALVVPAWLDLGCTAAGA